ncbi:unnamed protein product, partial [Prorocentrum cordatum]
MTLLTRSLADRWGLISDQAVSALMNPNRLSQERIGNLLARFDILRSRVRQSGQFMIGCGRHGYLLLRAVGSSNIQRAMILQHCNMAYPANVQQLSHMTSQLRRIGQHLKHIPWKSRRSAGRGGLASCGARGSGNGGACAAAAWPRAPRSEAELDKSEDQKKELERGIEVSNTA